MCELHPFKCTTCGRKWLAHKKLASCESADPAARCPESLCMYVGSTRRPRGGECEPCRHVREVTEGLEDEDWELETGLLGLEPLGTRGRDAVDGGIEEECEMLGSGSGGPA